jgi:PAS domain-containing protein
MQSHNGSLPKNIELTFVDSSGYKKDIYLALGILENDRKSIATLIDITELKNEANIKKAENIYKAIFESTKSPMAIIDKDSNILLANNAMEELTGFKKTDIEGKKKYSDFLIKDNEQ